jgi:hypothetical protein
MNCHIWMRKNFRLYFGKGPPFKWKKSKFFFSSIYDNSYTIWKPMSSSFEMEKNGDFIFMNTKKNHVRCINCTLLFKIFVLSKNGKNLT